MPRSTPSPAPRPARSTGSRFSDELDDHILRSLRQIIRSVDLYSKKLSREFTVTGPQLLCLRKLVADGPQSTGSLAKAMTLSPATVTGVLDRLEGRGFISRQRSQTDRRQVLISATEAGQELVAVAPPSLDERFTRRLHALPISAQEKIASCLAEIVEMMEATDLDAAPILAPGAELGERAGAAGSPPDSRTEDS